MSTVLILGGTGLAGHLADRLTKSTRLTVISSLAGRTERPNLPAGEVRIGGFGGPEALAEWLRAHRAGAVIDATHPFASRIGASAAEACTQTGVPLLRLESPAWVPGPDDTWIDVADWPQACARIADIKAKRVLLAIGRQDVGAFTKLEDVWFLVRSVDPPALLPPMAKMLLGRGPFSLDAERGLLARNRIDAIVCKNSGGESSRAKLIAAADANIPVIMRQRPPRPAAECAETVDQAVEWLIRLGLPER